MRLDRPLTNGQLWCYEDEAALYTAAARSFVETARAAIHERGRFVVALSGGSTPRGLYRRLASADLRGEVDWSCVEFFWSDERCVDPGDEASNFRMASETLLAPLGIRAEKVHRMQAERDDLEQAADDYAGEIGTCLGISPSDSPPAFDLILLGMGGDGHTASLFPFTRALNVDDRWVTANEVPQLGTRRMTMTLPLINAARAVTFLVAGESKAAALNAVLAGPKRGNQLPSQLVAPTNGWLEWLVDRAAIAFEPMGLNVAEEPK